MNSEEKASPAADVAMRLEMTKLVEYGLSGQPVSADSHQFSEHDTSCGVAMLLHMKHAENGESTTSE